MMTKEEQKYALAEWMGYVWYRAPQDHHFPDKKYRFLAWPAIQEYEGQIDIWKQRADGTEKIIDSKEWRKAQGVDYVPDYPEDLNAMREVESKIPPHKRGFYNAELSKLATNRNLSSTVKEPEFIFMLLNASSEHRSESACRILFPQRWV
jgi:hypothetical protein